MFIFAVKPYRMLNTFTSVTILHKQSYVLKELKTEKVCWDLANRMKFCLDGKKEEKVAKSYK